MMRLIQLSTEWCGPCQAARRYIQEEYPEDTLNKRYLYVDLESRPLPEVAKAVLSRVMPKGVPMFAVVNEDDYVMSHFFGFDRKRINEFGDAYLKEGEAVTDISNTIFKEKEE